MKINLSLSHAHIVTLLASTKTSLQMLEASLEVRNKIDVACSQTFAHVTIVKRSKVTLEIEREADALRELATYLNFKLKQRATLHADAYKQRA